MSENNDLPLDGRPGNLYDPMFTDRITALDGRRVRHGPEAAPPWVGVLVGFLFMGLLHCFVTCEPRDLAAPPAPEPTLAEEVDLLLPLADNDSVRTVSVVCRAPPHEGNAAGGPGPDLPAALHRPQDR